MSFSLELWTAVATRAQALIYAAGADPEDVPTLEVLSGAGETLATITLLPEHSTVTRAGELKIGIMDTGHAIADGTAAAARVKDASGQAHIYLPCTEGTEPAPGFCVLNTRTLSTGALVTIMDLTLPVDEPL